MVGQTRAVLDGYAAAGGTYREEVIPDSGHGPHLDQPERFRATLVEFLESGSLNAVLLSPRRRCAG
jgi:pimeloyl-ACP methyl ester carboxylesterase